MIHISGKTYEVIVDHKNGWRFEAFRDRYSEVLERYDYIVGDWGYSQLRLRGFFKDNHPKGAKDTVISTLPDYLNEYCNFGCAYFIIEKVANKQPHGKPGESIPESGIWQDGEPEEPEDSEQLDADKQQDQEQQPVGQASDQAKATAEAQQWEPNRRQQHPNGKGQHQSRGSRSGSSQRNHDGKQGGTSRGQAQSQQGQTSQQQGEFNPKAAHSHKQGRGSKHLGSNHQQKPKTESSRVEA
ncbi:YutD-like domain-containing protein [Paenibacillus sp. PvR098]|uniref:YutD family protein n=1 Tax=unclassified Paenibacillus TaxID=185978 RepID=UPI001B62F287|nr:uncharacterized protein YutD [Paenibacillus sp. PvP091]MBP1172336.1 uncharacterized protein YutD [Paenibacillus sp. PvR098]MBP2438717.1 uncharacterized protein YutD [Paenibacillus sp. PvP052]